MKIKVIVSIILIIISPRGFAATEFNMTFNTAAPGGTYNPKNVVAVWVTQTNGTIVKTILRYGEEKKTSLSTWNAADGASVDGKMGATRLNHSAPVTMTATWDLKNKSGVVVPDGTYRINLEMADGTRKTHSFDFVKDSATGTRTNPGTTWFKNISIAYAPPAAANTAPVAQSQNLIASDGNTLAITLGATDAEINAITYNLVSQPVSGHLLGTPPALTYVPVRGLNGSASFTFNANDGLLTGNTATVAVSLVFTDSNGNGIPNTWESAYGVTDAAADPDGDGSSNYAEYMAGTDPTNKASLFAVNAPQPTGGFGVVIKWSSVKDHFYSVLASTNLTSGWSTLVSNTFATPPLNSYTGTYNQAGPTFYRIRLEP